MEAQYEELSVEQITGGYSSLPVIQDLNLNLKKGEWLSLIGANGSGKSTALKLISRILAPCQGAVYLEGKVIHTQPPHQVAQKLALLPQQNRVPSGLTVWQLVSLGRSPHQPWWQWEMTTADREKVEAAIAETELTLFRDRPVEALSGGERQRAFLALALAQDPKVLLLDEPTTYLDVHYQLHLLELLKRFNRNGLSIITVLHDINLAARYSDRIALLRQGRLWAVGVPRKVLTPAHLAEVFHVEVAVLETPVGIQICPLTFCEAFSQLSSNPV